MSARYPSLYGKASTLVNRIASVRGNIKRSFDDSKYQTLPDPTPFTLMHPTTYVSPTAQKIISLSKSLANDGDNDEVSAASKRASTMAMHTTSPNASHPGYDEDLASSSPSEKDYSEAADMSLTLTPPSTAEHESVGESNDDDSLATPTATGNRHLQSPRPAPTQGRADRLSLTSSWQMAARFELFDSFAAAATRSTNEIFDVFTDAQPRISSPPPSKVDDSDAEDAADSDGDIFYTPSTGSVMNVSPPAAGGKDVFSASPGVYSHSSCIALLTLSLVRPELMDIVFRTPTSTKRKRHGFAGPSKPAPSNADTDVARASKRQKRQPETSKPQRRQPKKATKASQAPKAREAPKLRSGVRVR
ncbi:hypothetical protein CYLTODRAFT_414805 [Cylindrobasidium torrendii FP15055 ss-10]|uniref:Uncharacterized protein n=1 Tax=Cylindrobasidium torrendii FP15055 ss-10 TaxID=1314674 RepID=A0A0D7AYJ9_9AGAR|nr:hypothetical protein CYLTODRAFT_414805 [Cylindrobasidium torrendii FP15055 ss-10]